MQAWDTPPGHDDFPAVLEFDDGAEVTLEARDHEYDHREWCFIRWEWTTSGPPPTEHWDMDPILEVYVNTELTREAVYLSANLDIYDGQNGPVVGEAEEETRGAFTVANQNDTDGNGTADWDDTTVPGEVDLIKVRLATPIPAGAVSKFEEEERLVFSVGPMGCLWESSEKGTLFQSPLELSDLPKTLWLEGEEHSSAPRDDSVVYQCIVKGDEPEEENQASDKAAVTFFELGNPRLRGVQRRGRLVG